MQSEEVLVPEERKHSPVEELFDYIVQRLLDFAAGIGRQAPAGLDAAALGHCHLGFFPPSFTRPDLRFQSVGSALLEAWKQMFWSVL